MNITELELKELCKPISDYLKKNCDPYCTVIIADQSVKLVRDQISIPTYTQSANRED